MSVELRKYLRPEQVSVPAPFCAGCGNGILRGLILRAIDELGINMDDMLFVGGIGCAGSSIASSFRADILHTLHGRALAFATGAKLFNPRLTTLVVSGDGDLADIGGNHLIHAARRNIDVKVIVSNNSCYGTTGGQVCSTTPQNAFTTTTMKGNPYRPFDLCKLVIAAGASYAARYAITQPLEIVNSIKKVFKKKGFTFIEVLLPCPVQFGRRNGWDTQADIFRYLLENCISIKEANKYQLWQLKDKIVTGEFLDG